MRAKFRGSVYDLALDSFRLSFCLMNMNATDMFSAERLEDNVLIYERQKTKNKRKDRAEIHVEVNPYIAELMKVYKGTNGKVFNFSEHFNSLEVFTISLANGMKQISKELGLDRLQFMQPDTRQTINAQMQAKGISVTTNNT